MLTAILVARIRNCIRTGIHKVAGSDFRCKNLVFFSRIRIHRSRHFDKSGSDSVQAVAESESGFRLSRVGKNPGFFEEKKTSPVGFFGLFWFFCVFWVFFGVFLFFFFPEEKVLGSVFEPEPEPKET